MSTTKCKFCSTPMQLRTLAVVFLILNILGLTSIYFLSPQTYSFAIQNSLRVRSDISDALKKMLNTEDKSNKTINETIHPQNTSEKRTYEGKIRPVVEVERINALNQTIDEGKKKEANTMHYDILGNPIVQGARIHTNIKRQDVCNNCFKHEFKYLINNPDICKLFPSQTEIELLILIQTVHKNTMERNALRETWLTYSRNNTANVRYAFLFGKIQNQTLQESLYRESQQYKDILQENFVDVYKNLTYKTIMGFKWAVANCGSAKAILKTDDDMYINVPNVLNIVKQELISLQTNIIGSCTQAASPIRNSKSKWFASVRSYPGKKYAGFCSGTGYVTSLNIAQKVFEVSRHVPFFHLEDVYVALCIQKLGYHLKTYPGFHPDHPKLDPCLYNSKKLVTSHYMTPDQIRKMWREKCAATSRT